MRRLAFAAACLMLGATAPAAPDFLLEGDAPPTARYLTGGVEPFAPATQARLDARRGIVSLGINTAWLVDSGIAREPFANGILAVADAVERGETPGAVILLRRPLGEMLPIAAGWMMTDPQRAHAQYSTRYELGELTGLATALPIALGALMEGRLDAESTLDSHLPWLAGTALGGRTVGDALRHRTGLPGEIGLDGEPTPERARAALAAAPLGEPGFSRHNDLLLGLVLSQVYQEPAQVLARERLFAPLGMAETSFGAQGDRYRIAPGSYSNFRGRLAWGETEDPLAAAFGGDALSGGLVSTAEDLGRLAVALVAMMRQGGGDAEQWEGALARGGFGEGSIGRDGAEGCSLWLLPDEWVVLVYLSNQAHPTPAAPVDPRPAAFKELRAAVEPWDAAVLEAPPAGAAAP
ncbi:MAG: serine hydrolase domain-containing protein [Candidatus Sumerlaeia bacterium]|nr:serine hydrolase domain-containing protein [Candidatus Sumerlaeia bacterium]